LTWFWIIAGGVILYFLFRGGGGSSGSSSAPSSTGTRRADQVPSSLTSGKGYRPSGRSASSSGITFGSDSPHNVTARLGENVTDFLTGATFGTSASTYQCTNCQAFYSVESYELLRAENSERCASCRSSTLRLLGGQQAGPAHRPIRKPNASQQPGAATLENYRGFAEQVVTFTGRVIRIIESRRGGDFAVMFEDKSWKAGFKLVFFKDSLASLGGSAFVKGLRGSTITVRGLVVNHRQYGYEIIINDRRMLLKVDR
jgi:hypothetical protein